jgi:dTDP-4-amino-4,6-dideoxygalactose transaminase
MTKGPGLHPGTLLQANATIADALASLTETGKGIALLPREDGTLWRLYTDGDLRRLVMAHHPVTKLLASLGHRQPRTAPQGTSRSEALSMMDHWRIDHLPLVNADGLPIGLYLRREIAERIWLSAPHMGEDELHFVNQAFATNWVAPLGPNVDAFERELAAKVTVPHAAALSSGTAALHLALVLLGVRRGDRVACSSLTFAASAFPIVYQGAEPVFVDSSEDSWNMCPIALERALEADARSGRHIKAVIVVDLYGQPADYDTLAPVCEHYGVPIIEDAAEALGSKYKGRSCGALGDVGVFSFNGNKIITTSGGGMIVGENQELIAHARKLSTQAREDKPWYEHEEIGYNYRMSNVLAGIGRGQLARLEERVGARRAVFEQYREQLEPVDAVGWMPEYEGSYSNRWLSTCILERGLDPQAVCDDLARLDIEVRRVWKPMHQQPVFAGSAYYTAGNVDVAGMLFERGLCLPSGSNMSEAQIDRVCEAFAGAVARAHDGAATA